MNLQNAKNAAREAGSFKIRRESVGIVYDLKPTNLSFKRYEPSATDQNAKDWEVAEAQSEDAHRCRRLRNVKVGDWIWLRSGNSYSQGYGVGKDRLREVTKITDTLIVCDQGGEFDRYNRFTGYQSGRQMWADRITTTATKAEVAKHKQDQEIAAAARTAKQDAEIVMTNLTAELNGGFTEGTPAYINGNAEKQVFEVRFTGLTEAQVRKLVAAANEAKL